jgi:hypothetical protein
VLGDNNTCPAVRGPIPEDRGVVIWLAPGLRQAASMSQAAITTADSPSSHEPHAQEPLGAGSRESPSAGWEQYVAELRGRLDDVNALLSLVDNADAPPGLVHERWLALVRKLVDLADPGSAQPLPVLEALGRECGSVRLGQRTLHLTRRHTELLVLLAGHPNGMRTEEIAYGLYGDPGRPASVRTGLCRVRKGLAPWIYTERNRVKLEIDADFLVVGRLLRAGRVREAARLYSAPLLPRSEAPGVVEARNQLDAWVRSAVMTYGDEEALWTWLGSDSGADDALAWKRLLAQLDFGDPRRSLTVSRLGQLRNALGRAA